MPKPVLINGLSAVHKDSGGKLLTMDVCLTKVGKPIVPIPYANTAFSQDAAATASSVRINGQPACHLGSVFSKSQGDEPGDHKGVKSGDLGGEASFLMGSPNVFIEGQPAVRAFDLMVSNSENTPPAPLIQDAGSPPTPLQRQALAEAERPETTWMVHVEIINRTPYPIAGYLEVTEAVILPARRPCTPEPASPTAASNGTSSPATPTAALADDENDLKWLEVPFGRLTFEAEGKDDPEDTNTFSRTPHLPSDSDGKPIGQSGITIGRGFDVGQFTSAEVGRFLTLAPEDQVRPLPTRLLNWLKVAAGKKHDAATRHFNTLKSTFPDTEERTLTHKQQYFLFKAVYAHLKQDVQRITRDPTNAHIYGSADLDQLDPLLVDLLVDLRFRGDYSPRTRPYLQKAFVESAANPRQKEAFIKAICARALWFSNSEFRYKGRKIEIDNLLPSIFGDIPTDRYKRRAGYLLSQGRSLAAASDAQLEAYTPLVIQPRYNAWHGNWGNEATLGRFQDELRQQRAYVAAITDEDPELI